MLKIVENCDKNTRQKMSLIVKIVNNKKFVKMLIRSCFLITLIECLKGHSVMSKSKVTQWLSEWKAHLLSCSGQLTSSHKTYVVCEHLSTFHGIQSWLYDWVICSLRTLVKGVSATQSGWCDTIVLGWCKIQKVAFENHIVTWLH